LAFGSILHEFLIKNTNSSNLNFQMLITWRFCAHECKCTFAKLWITTSPK
jgi:hypothetical protein